MTVTDIAPVPEDLVAEGVELDRKEGDLKWEWGDLMLKVAPGQGTGRGGLRVAGDTITERIQVYVDQLEEAGVEREVRTLELYRATAEAWGKDTRGSLPSYRIGYELRGQPDRLDLVRGHRFTVSQARELVSIRTMVKEDCALDEYLAFLAARDENPELTAAEFFKVVESEKANELLTLLWIAEPVSIPAGSLDDISKKQERTLRVYIKTMRELLEQIEAALQERSK
jgi:hypothetical protein